MAVGRSDLGVSFFGGGSSLFNHKEGDKIFESGGRDGGDRRKKFSAEKGGQNFTFMCPNSKFSLPSATKLGLGCLGGDRFFWLLGRESPPHPPGHLLL